MTKAPVSMALVALTLWGLGPAALAAEPRCEDLHTPLISNVTISAAELVPAGGFKAPDGRVHDVKPFCRVHGVARPTARSEIHFEVWLPEKSRWNGRFYQHGEGSSGGAINYRALAQLVGRGNAAAATDDGVRRSLGSFEDIEALYRIWAKERDNPEQVIDNSYRAMIETTRSAKALIRWYYGARDLRSYFSGCSGGGNYALKAVQRIPREWDGVLVGAPSNNATRYFIANIWNSGRAMDPATRLAANKLPAIQKAALASCWPRAHVIDGIPTDPRFCNFDPSPLQCTGTETDECLTPGQLQTLKRIYGGPTNPRTGESLYPGFPAGSEAGWSPFLVPAREGNRFGSLTYSLYSANVFVQYVFGPEQRERRMSSFDFDRDVSWAEDLRIAGQRLADVYNATEADLGEFRRRGSKILMYFGWDDPALTPLEGIRYYEQVSRASGGLEQTREFFRMFMVPGMAHCGGGPGANAFGQVLTPSLRDDAEHDVSRALEAWVEQGRKPEHLVAAKFREDVPERGVVFTRLLCPYPQIAIHGGAGDRKLASHYRCAVQ